MKKEAAKKGQNIEKILIENFVSLQKVMVNLSSKFDELTLKISKLLELFEISAKTLSEKEVGGDNKLAEKIDVLLNQNKTLAKGLALMYEKMPSQSINVELPRFNRQPQEEQESENPRKTSQNIPGEYQKSMQVGSNSPTLPESKFKQFQKR